MYINFIVIVFVFAVPDIILGNGIYKIIYPAVFLGFIVLNRFYTVSAQEFNKVIAVDPDFIDAFLLGFVKYQLDAEMKMGGVDIVGIFRSAVTGSAKIADNISSLYNTAHLEFFIVREVLA